MRRLIDLVSVGPATVDDLSLLGIEAVDQLIGKDPFELYERLCKKTGKRHCICVADVFAAAIAQAEDPALPFEQCQWSYYSQRRKSSCP